MPLQHTAGGGDGLPLIADKEVLQLAGACTSLDHELMLVLRMISPPRARSPHLWCHPNTLLPCWSRQCSARHKSPASMNSVTCRPSMCMSQCLAVVPDGQGPPVTYQGMQGTAQLRALQTRQLCSSQRIATLTILSDAHFDPPSATLASTP